MMADRSQEPAPAPVMSRKSAFVTATVAAVTVRLVPKVLPENRTRLVALLPLHVNVPVTVMGPPILCEPTVSAAPVLVKFVNVTVAPPCDVLVAPVPVNTTEYHVSVPDEKVAAAPDNVMTEVPEFNVRPVIVAVFHAVPVPVIAIALDPRVSERVFVFADANVPYVID